MMLGKTVLDESHPQFIGLYQGDRSRDYVRERIEKADCVLQLGALPTDFNTGGFTVKLSEDRTISANYRSVQIKRHIYPDVTLRDFILGLTGRLRPLGRGDAGHQAGHRGLHAPADDRLRAPAGQAVDDPPLLRSRRPLPGARGRGHRRDRRGPLQRGRDPDAGRGEVHRPDLLRLDRLHRRRHAGREPGRTGSPGRAASWATAHSRSPARTSRP